MWHAFVTFKLQSRQTVFICFGNMWRILHFAKCKEWCVFWRTIQRQDHDPRDSVFVVIWLLSLLGLAIHHQWPQTTGLPWPLAPAETWTRTIIKKLFVSKKLFHKISISNYVHSKSFGACLPCSSMKWWQVFIFSVLTLHFFYINIRKTKQNKTPHSNNVSPNKTCVTYIFFH